VPMGDHVIDVVRHLPPKRRALVVLRYYSGLTDAEIAETTGLPVGTVKSTLHRALAELRKELA
jgi:RNA polymerase sigma factor (sigma-70 family)